MARHKRKAPSVLNARRRKSPPRPQPPASSEQEAAAYQAVQRLLSLRDYAEHRRDSAAELLPEFDEDLARFIDTAAGRRTASRWFHSAGDVVAVLESAADGNPLGQFQAQVWIMQSDVLLDSLKASVQFDLAIARDAQTGALATDSQSTAVMPPGLGH